MGHRTVKRVPLNFKAPLKTVWEGYLNPFRKASKKCESCDGSGCSPAVKFLSDSWYRHIAGQMFGAFFGDSIHSVRQEEWYRRVGWPEEVVRNIGFAKRFGFTTLTHWSDKLHPDEVAALVEADRLRDLTHTWDPEKRWVKKDPVVVPTPEEVAVWGAHTMGHDAINQWVCVKARAKRFGLDKENKKEWDCASCGGEGEIWPDQEAKEKSEKWESQEPPSGPGWQLWETVTEGSPISPVFETPGGLAKWCAKNATIFADEKLSEQQWLKIIRDDSVEVGSLGLIGGKSGVVSVAKEEMGEESPRDWMPDKKE